MNAAVYALAGTALGALSALGTEEFRSRRSLRAQRSQALTDVAVGLAAAIARMKQAAIDAKGDEGAKPRFHAAHEDARSCFERLRLLSGSVDTQRAARYSIRYAFGLWRHLVLGRPLREDEIERGPVVELEAHLAAFFVAIRREAGLPDADSVFQEPIELQFPYDPPLQSGDPGGC